MKVKTIIKILKILSDNVKAKNIKQYGFYNTEFLYTAWFEDSLDNTIQALETTLITEDENK